MHPALTGLLFAAIPFYIPFLLLPIQPVFSFLFTAMHVKSLAFGVWEWRRYSIQSIYDSVMLCAKGTYMQLW